MSNIKFLSYVTHTNTAKEEEDEVERFLVLFNSLESGPNFN